MSMVSRTQAAQSNSYVDLPCTSEDKQRIYTLITQVATLNKMNLLAKKGELEDLGKEIRRIHPLKFLAIIFKDPALKNCMKKIFEDTFKRLEFSKGLQSSMNEQARVGKISPFINDFAQEIQLPQKNMAGLNLLLNQKRWDDTVRLLINPAID